LACNPTDEWNCSKIGASGLFLQSVSMTSASSGKYELRFGFETSDYSSASSYREITIHNVVQCKILNWWSKDYPDNLGENVIES